MFPRVNAYPAADRDTLSLVWGRQFVRIVAVQQRPNTIIELEERRPDRLVRRFLRLARSPGWSEEEINSELNLLRSVPAVSKVAVARPLSGANGCYLQRQGWNGAVRYACLFQAAAGRDLEVSEADLSRFGQALADLHAALSELMDPTPGRRIDVAEICRATSRWLLPHGIPAAALADDIQAAAPMLEEAFNRSLLPSGACHGDANIRNAKLDGDQITFFDFDECVFGPLALDLVAMAAWLRPEPNGGTLWAALVGGYTKRRSLTPDELAALPMLALISELRVTHNLARFCTMPDNLWKEMRMQVGRRINDFRVVQKCPDLVQQLP